MIRKKNILYIIPLSMLFLQLNCKKEPPVTPPPQQEDSIITYERELTDGQEPAVSPDGKKIAYTYNGCIYVMDTSGANITQLTSGSADILPRWHPNGQTVGFIRSTPSVYNHGVLYSVPVSGGGVTQLVLNHFIADSLIQISRIYGGYVAVPIWDWSPDGNYIAFFSVNGYSFVLNAVSLIGGNDVFLKETYNKFFSGSAGGSFVWSSELNKIAFVASSEHRYGAIYLYDIDLHSEIIDSSYSFPNYISRNDLSNKFVFVGLNESSTPVIVETNFSSVIYEYQTMGSQGLKWSPDGKYFLFEFQGIVSGAYGYEYSRLFIYSLEKNKNFQLTSKGDINLHNYFFEWGKTSNIIFFERFNKICSISFIIPQ